MSAEEPGTPLPTQTFAPEAQTYQRVQGEVVLRDVSVVVPVYNSEGSLAELVARLEPVLRENTARFELILVNDGSRDRSWEVVAQLAAQHSWIRGFNMMRNYGQHNALLCGIRAARYDTLITMDDDLQHPPTEIPTLLTALDEGYDVVYGTPHQQQHGLLRNLASQLTKKALENAMGVPAARNVSAFRVFNTQIRDAFARYQSPSICLDVLLTWGTTRFGSVTVRHDTRYAGVSNYNLRKLIRHAMTMTTGFSTWPLQMASFVGFGFTLFGIALLLWVVGRYLLFGSMVPGFPFLASAIAIFSGAQLFALGIIGEYLARMHFRMMDRPPYAVREETSSLTRASSHSEPLVSLEVNRSHHE